LVVLFTLYLKEDVDEHGNVKEGVEGGKPFEGRAVGVDVDGEMAEGKGVGGKEGGGLGGGEEKLPDTNEDDVD
jgi:hypothetical protein